MYSLQQIACRLFKYALKVTDSVAKKYINVKQSSVASHDCLEAFLCKVVTIFSSLVFMYICMYTIYAHTYIYKILSEELTFYVPEVFFFFFSYLSCYFKNKLFGKYEKYTVSN